MCLYPIWVGCSLSKVYTNVILHFEVKQKWSELMQGDTHGGMGALHEFWVGSPLNVMYIHII